MKRVISFFIQHQKSTAVGFLICICIGIVLGVYNLSGGELSIVTAQKKNIREEVSVTGRVISKKTAKLAFERGGKVAYIAVEVGDRVAAGQYLAQLNNVDVVAQIQEKEAALKVQRAQLADLLAGTRLEEISVQESELQRAYQERENLYGDALAQITEVFNKADEAVRIKTASVFVGSWSGSYQLAFEACNVAREETAKMLRRQSEARLEFWQKEIENYSLDVSKITIHKGLYNAQAYLAHFQNFFREISGVLAEGCAGSNSSLDTHRANISSARNNIDVALTTITGVQQSIVVQEKIIETNKHQLALKKAGARPELILIEEARIEQAEATLKNTQAQWGKTTIESPFSGIVTAVDIAVGEIASTNDPAITLTTDNNLSIEAYVPEVDISKIQQGNLVKVTLDAYTSDDIFSARVASIDPTETIIEGVSTYRILLSFTNDDKRIRPGMTANGDIITDFRSNILIIPARAVTYKEGTQYVRVLQNNNTVSESKVIIGLKSLSGDVEIISGIQEGDNVIVSSE